MGMIGEIYELLRMEIEICEKNDWNCEIYGWNPKLV